MELLDMSDNTVHSGAHGLRIATLYSRRYPCYTTKQENEADG